MRQISYDDLALSLSHYIHPIVEIQIYDRYDHYLDSITGGLTGGSFTLNPDSDVRRTFNFTLVPDRKLDERIVEGTYFWMDKRIRLYLGYRDVRKNDIKYAQGKYVFTDASISYDITNNQVSVNASDYVATLDGSVNGQMGALTTKYPAYEYIDADYFINRDVTYENNIYTVSDDGYAIQDHVGKTVALSINATNLAGAKIDINSTGALPIYGEDGNHLPAGGIDLSATRVSTSIFRTESDRYVYVGQYAEITKYNYIRDAVIITLRELARITEYNVEEIGEYKAMPQYNEDWEVYREQSATKVHDGSFQPVWNAIPYDQEFSAGCSIWSILTTFRDLYPNYEMGFDEDGIFFCRMIPSSYDDDVVLKNDYMHKILISENTSIDFKTVRNVCLVYGQALEPDFYFIETSYANNSYEMLNSEESMQGHFYNGDAVGFKTPKGVGDNQAAPSIHFPFARDGEDNDVQIPIYDEDTDEPLEAGMLHEDSTYVVKLRSKYVNKQNVLRAYLLGQYQPVGMNVLTDGTISEDIYTTFDGRQVPVYSKEYFQDVYNVANVEFMIVPDSPFTIQKLGVILDVKTGGEFDNITSDSRALARAEWENWKNCRLTDTITLTTKYVPWMPENAKIEYQGVNEDRPYQYITKNISHDFSGENSSITLMRFYPLYIPE